MNLKDVPITDLMYIIPDDIKAVLVGIFGFLIILAIWRIVTG